MSYKTNNIDGYSISLEDTIMATGSSSDTFTITGNTSPYNYQYNWTTDHTGAVPTISIAPSTSPYVTDTITLGDWANVNPSHTLDVKGDANFEGDVKIKGKSLVESLEKIEEKLAILRPNEQLEEKWDKLRELRKQYMELEKEIIEKEKMWDILKK